MRIGVAYYPEHWPEERWPVDARMLRETGIEVVRIGEFAWSRLEPRRGQYDGDWLERVIELLAVEGLKVILCTPTAAPPPWLFHRHPSMPAQDREGKNWYRGSRRIICLNNRPYRRYVRRILREMGRRFARNPHVFAWQIDNEIGCHGSGRCYCDDCEQAFREWLRRRYGTIDRLNRLWGTVFWSQEFHDWHLIPAPRRTPAGPHPSLVLDYQRFTSAAVRDFVGEQRDLIEEYTKGSVLFTTNCLGLSTDQIDQFSLGGPQDVASYDNYPLSAENLDNVAMQLDLARSIKRAPFWVLEQQAGATMVHTRRSQPRAGQLRLWALQAAARGAGLLAFFRWRTCAFAQEMHWYGMLEPDGASSRRFEEIKGTIAELKEKSHLWEGRLPSARVAMVLDYHSHWALKGDAMCAGLDFLAQFRAMYGLLRRMGVGVHIIQPGDDAGGYDMLVAPMPVISRERVAARWIDFVNGGGTLLATAPAGCRTEHNTAVMATRPGHYAEVLGVRVIEHDVLGAGTDSAIVWEEQRFPLKSFCYALALQGAEALATYDDEHYNGLPAVTRRTLGEGSAWFLGALSTPALLERLLQGALADAGIEQHPWSSEAVEVIPLSATAEQQPLTAVLNHSRDAVELELPDGAVRRDLLTGADHESAVPLDGYGVVLLEG